MTPKIVLAKYVPDLSRMEPRNIGVFLWTKGNVYAKFLEDSDASFVGDSKNFARWKKFWNGLVTAEAIRPKRGKPVDKKTSACMDALLSTQEGNYLLVDAGELLEAVGKREAQSAVEFLFKELVQTKSDSVSATARSPTGLKAKCDHVFTDNRLSGRDDFKRAYAVPVGVFGLERRFHFSYGFGNGKPLAVVQRAELDREMSVNNAALMLHEVSDNDIVSRNHCVALVQKSLTESSESAEEAYKWLARFCQVIDVDEAAAADQVADLIPKGHTD